jgi:hypothetical protein
MFAGGGYLFRYAVAPDGKRFLIIPLSGGAATLTDHRVLSGGKVTPRLEGGGAGCCNT